MPMAPLKKRKRKRARRKRRKKRSRKKKQEDERQRKEREEQGKKKPEEGKRKNEDRKTTIGKGEESKGSEAQSIEDVTTQTVGTKKGFLSERKSRAKDLERPRDSTCYICLNSLAYVGTYVPCTAPGSTTYNLSTGNAKWNRPQFTGAGPCHAEYFTPGAPLAGLVIPEHAAVFKVLPRDQSGLRKLHTLVFFVYGGLEETRDAVESYHVEDVAAAG
ncbi:MAG: hypothetical protein Q9188_004648 [Gyalolechia gomerana]